MKTLVSVVCLVASVATAHADRASIADTLSKLGGSAAAISTAAKSSDDRGARKKLAPAATDIADDLNALSRRAAKADVPLKSVGKDAAAIDSDASKLVDIVDEVEDKDERKALRAQAIALQQGVAAIRKTIDAQAEKGDKSDKPAAAAAFTGQFVNNSDACSWSENMYFSVSSNGQQVWKSGLVFPGKQQTIALYQGTYFVLFEGPGAGSQYGKGTLVVNKEGWEFKSGCVNQ